MKKLIFTILSVTMSTALLTACKEKQLGSQSAVKDQSAMSGVVSEPLAVDNPAIKKLISTLQLKLPELQFDSVLETPVLDVYELLVGTQVLYVTADAKYIFSGDLIDVGTQTNLSDQRKGRIYIDNLAALGEENMLIFPAISKQDQIRTITVVTDSTCPYCSRLHEEIDVLLSAGVSVRYLLFPRAGLKSSAYDELQSVWCADDRQQALTDAKARKGVPEKTCENPIADHVAFAQNAGFRGTPTIILDSGAVVPGYRPAQQILRMLESSPSL